MRKWIGALLVTMLSVCALTCGGGESGGGGSVTDPAACSPALAGGWTWTVQPPCGNSYSGNSEATFDSSSCTLSIEITTAEQRSRGLAQTLRMNMSAMTATVTQNAAPCASTDQGRIIRDPSAYRVTLTRAPNGNCCAGNWVISLTHGT